MSEVLRSVSPQRPERVVAEEPAADAAGVVATVSAARRAGAEWWSLTGTVRSAALTRAAEALAARVDEFTDLVVAEVGKPRSEAAGEVARGIAILRYYAQDALRGLGDVLPTSAPGVLYTEQRPHGVAGLITPWNFPVAIPLWKAAPALAAGNAVVLKPSTAALACARLLAETLASALPAGLFHVVGGEKDIATALIDSVDVASFTGSTAVGRSVVVRAATRGIPVQAEMGGQNAAVVLPDADLEATAILLAGAAMGYAGQKCTATRRVVVVGDAEPLTDALAARIDALPVGDPDAADTVVGPVISAQAVKAVSAAVERTRADGGTVVLRGKVPEEGFYAAPSLVTGLPGNHPLNRAETFGPLATILAVETVEEAITLANSTDQGLVTSVHGHDLDRVMTVVRGLHTGMIKVNTPSTGVDFHAPFGGEKASSYGLREQGPRARDFYSSTRTITLGYGS